MKSRKFARIVNSIPLHVQRDRLAIERESLFHSLHGNTNGTFNKLIKAVLVSLIGGNLYRVPGTNPGTPTLR